MSAPCTQCGGLDPSEYINDPPHTLCPRCLGSGEEPTVVELMERLEASLHQAQIERAERDQRRRLLTCIEVWPECEEGKYDPRCCRFPKSCSCTVYGDDIEPSLLESRV